MIGTEIATKAFRFELAFDGEPEHVGVFQGVSDIGLAEDEVNSFLAEFSDLKIPELSRNSESWFTLLGLKEFFEAIKDFSAKLEETGWSILMYVRDMTVQEVKAAKYRDAYQIVLNSKTSDIRNLVPMELTA